MDARRSVLLAFVAAILWWPLAVAAPLAVIGAWIAFSLLVKAWRLRRSPRAPIGTERDSSARDEPQR